MEFMESVARAAAVIGPLFEPTPLQLNQYLSERHGARVFLKREDLSPVRSYKIRGAYSFFAGALEGAGATAAQRRFVCASAGNHAQGFAHACRQFRVKGTVFMPVTTPRQKIMKTAGFGAPFVEVRLSGDTFDASYAEAARFCADTGATMAPPFDDERVIAGQATVAAEIAAQMPPGEAIDIVVLPVGGGGLAAGVTQYLRAVSPSTRFVFVEPDAAASLKRSLEEGDRVRLPKVDNFVDGAAVAQIGALNWEALRRYSPDDVVLAPTGGVCATMIDLLNVEGIVLEPAGALSVDALNRIPRDLFAGRNVVCILSGGNFDFERLPEVKERALTFTGLKKYFILRLPQRPGALKDFLFLLGPDDDIARFEYLKKSARNFGSVLIGLETTKAENFAALKERIEAAGMQFQDITENELVANLVV